MRINPDLFELPKIQQEKDNYLQGKETILPSETYYQHIRRYDGI